jgi:hypothetical protein
MTGQPFRGGTSFSQILLDEAALIKLNKDIVVDDEEEEEDGDISGIIGDGSRTNNPCASANFEVNISMPATINTIEEPDIEIDVIDEDEEE